MSISAQAVKELRERTGAGMMECKKALVETDGDMEAAIEYLRKSGLAKADKKSSRVAAEGVIVHAGNTSDAVLVEINCETDFVAKDDHFQSFATQVAETAIAASGDDVAELLAMQFDDGETVETHRQQLIAKVGENIQVRRIARMRGVGTVASYIHGTRIGVLLGLEGGDEDLGRDLAMHVAALNPEFLDAASVPAEVLDKEKEILRAQAENSGKPPEIVEKMLSGRLGKRLAEITLLGQPFVKDGDLTVEALLQRAGARITGFTRLAVGEGIEKEETDFAAEVMQQARG